MHLKPVTQPIVLAVIKCVLLLTILQACDDDDFKVRELPKLEITKISPSTARRGEEITIKGKGFDGTYPSRNKILFLIETDTEGGGKQKKETVVNVVESKTTDNQITAIIPFNAINNPITVTVGDQKIVTNLLEIDTSVPAPKITTLNVSEGFPEDEITITGVDFTDEGIQPVVLFNTTRVVPIKSNETQIVVAIPKDQNIIGNIELKVERDGLLSNAIPFTVNEVPSTIPDIYWTSQINKTITVNTKDGQKTLYQTNKDAPKGIAVDTQNNLVYWINNTDIVSASADGSSATNTVLYTSANSLAGPVDIAINKNSNTIYILDYPPFTSTVNVFKGDLNNTAIGLTKVGEFTSNLSYPIITLGGIKIDANSGKFYINIHINDFTTTNEGNIYEGTLDASNKNITPVFNNETKKALGVIRNISIDTKNNELYILNNAETGFGDPRISILKGKLDGSGTLTEIFPNDTNFGNAYDLEIDTDNQFLYWLNQDPNGTINRANLNNKEIETVYTGISSGRYFDLNLTKN